MLLTLLLKQDLEDMFSLRSAPWGAYACGQGREVLDPMAAGCLGVARTGSTSHVLNAEAAEEQMKSEEERKRKDPTLFAHTA